jgi:cellulose biosynthesis protein BcsQ
MAKIISLFNHKGGVSKTTTTFNLGWMLAEKGHRVVMIDADPQCNLTGLVLDYETADGLDEFYAAHPNQNIRAGLAPAFESQPKAIEAVETVPVKEREGLSLLPGHVNLTEYEVTLGIAQELSGTLQALKNLPGAFYSFISLVGEANKADFLLIDMNPSLGSINQNLLMISDCFIVPTAPDYFSVMAIDSLATILPRWIQWARNAHELETLKSAAYPFPKLKLKFMGTVIQKYRPRKGKATEGFQTWIDAINERVVKSLFPTLQKHKVTFDEVIYAKAGVTPKEAFCLAQIADFNTLIAASQSNKTPVFALSNEMLGHSGVVLEQDQKKRDEFRAVFTVLADRVIALAKNA